MKRHIQQTRASKRWTKALIPGLILPGLLLAACQQGGSGGQESEPLKSSTAVQENVQPSAQPDADNGSTSAGQASAGTEGGQADPVMALRSQVRCKPRLRKRMEPRSSPMRLLIQSL